MRKINLVKYKDLHQKILDYQKEISPFTPTMRELQKVLDYSTNSCIEYFLKRMWQMNWMVRRNMATEGKRSKYIYYAVKIPDEIPPV